MCAATTTIELTAKDYKGPVDPDWCAGCGDFGVLNGLQRACADLGIMPHEILTVSGIGCSSNFPGYFNSYGMHTLHGRPLAVATGAKLGNHELNVIVTGGDGDGYGIGGNHFMHTARRNVNLTYLVMNNQIYGLTTGQASPTSPMDMKTKSTPYGNVERPINPLTTAIMNGATFVARGFSGDPRHLTELMKKAMQHKGFALVDIMSPCVTFNHDHTNQFFRERVTKLENEDHDVTDWKEACEKAMLWDEKIFIGIFYQAEGVPSLEDLEPVLDEGGPLAHRPLGISEDQAKKIIGSMM